MIFDAGFEPWSVDTKTITCQSDTVPMGLYEALPAEQRLLTLVPAAVFWRRLPTGSWGVFYPQAYLEF